MRPTGALGRADPRHAPADLPLTLARPAGRALRCLPGLALCTAIAGVAFVLAGLEAALLDRPGIGAIFWALILGIAARALRRPGESLLPGIHLSARRILEIAVVMFGSLLSLPAILALGPVLGAVIPLSVLVVVMGSFLAGRALGLGAREAALVASGNAICGNSAIAAVGSVIAARPAEISTAIALTAVPGLGIALSLPLLAPALGLEGAEYGVLTGMLIYALPQVPAATAPLGPLAVQLGLLVKLARVMMLGPVIVSLSWAVLGRRRRLGETVRQLVPWYVLGFFLLASAREAGLFPEALVAPTGQLAAMLTAVAMAGLGLQTDLRPIWQTGRRGLAAAGISLLLLLAVSVATVTAAGLALAHP